MNKLDTLPEKAIAIGVGLKSDSIQEIKESLIELEELIYAAGAEVAGSLTQTLLKYNPGTLLGKGKIQEIKKLVEETESTIVVVDHQLSGIQSRNLETEIGARVLDRSQLILDIFALRAHTYEGKLQVELAQMLDQLPRMVGAWQGSLSRQGGGVGTRGPGETALEMDRRRIRERVKQIQKKLEDLRKNRQQHRQKRKRQAIPSFALIGYTNSGKSTLLNKLTQSHVYAEDQVFATLDPTTRKIYLENLGNAVITDTVGFIRKLPTHLIEAFKATLEESSEADILLYVIDLSSPHRESQMKVINQLIEEFNWTNKPTLYVFNKCDLCPLELRFKVNNNPRVFISAKTGEGLENLKNQMIYIAQSLEQEFELFFPKEEEHKIYDLGRESMIVRKEVGTTGTICHVVISPHQISKWKNYLTATEEI